MTQVTVRRVEEGWVAKAKAEAKRRGVSMNEVLRQALRRGLGMEGERVRKMNLDRFAGDSDFGEDWDEIMEEFNRIDEESWN